MATKEEIWKELAEMSVSDYVICRMYRVASGHGDGDGGRCRPPPPPPPPPRHKRPHRPPGIGASPETIKPVEARVRRGEEAVSEKPSPPPISVLPDRPEIVKKRG